MHRRAGPARFAWTRRCHRKRCAMRRNANRGMRRRDPARTMRTGIGRNVSGTYRYSLRVGATAASSGSDARDALAAGPGRPAFEARKHASTTHRAPTSIHQKCCSDVTFAASKDVRIRARRDDRAEITDVCASICCARSRAMRVAPSATSQRFLECLRAVLRETEQSLRAERMRAFRFAEGVLPAQCLLLHAAPAAHHTRIPTTTPTAIITSTSSESSA